jgi:hypothetical protein
MASDLSKSTVSMTPSHRLPKVIHSLNIESEIPSPTQAQIERILIESVSTFAENLQSSINRVKETRTRQRGKPEGTEDESRCKQTLNMCWQPLLTICEKLLQLVTDDSNTQLLLRAYISLIGACGQAQVNDGRDAFLISLCRECVTFSKEAQVKEKNQLIATQRANRQPTMTLSSLFANAGDKCTVTPRNL